MLDETADINIEGVLWGAGFGTHKMSGGIEPKDQWKVARGEVLFIRRFAHGRDRDEVVEALMVALRQDIEQAKGIMAQRFYEEDLSVVERDGVDGHVVSISLRGAFV